MKSLHNTNIVRDHIDINNIEHYDILNIFKDYISIFKEKYLKNNIINSKAIFITKLEKQSPEFITLLNNYFGYEYIREVIYCILKDIHEIPRCPICNNYLYLRDFNKGFQITCSKSCLGKYQSQDKSFANKIRKTKLEKMVIEIIIQII